MKNKMLQGEDVRGPGAVLIPFTVLGKASTIRLSSQTSWKEQLGLGTNSSESLGVGVMQPLIPLPGPLRLSSSLGS